MRRTEVRQLFGARIMLNQYYRTRILLLLGSAVAMGTFWFIGSLLDVPAFMERGGSMLAQPSPIVALLAVVVAFAISLVLGTLIAGTVRVDAGLATAGVGLALLSARGGPIRYTLMYAQSERVFVMLALETVLLYVILSGGWLLLRALGRTGWVPMETEHEELADSDESLGNRAMALVAHAIVTALIILILGQSDDKAQTLATLFVASWVASMVSHHLFPTRPSPWYWCGPLLVAVIGYLLAASGSHLWMIGQVGGYAPALARPAPLDYASAGTAGALVGYWTSRRWREQEEEESVSEGTAVDAK